MRRIAAAFASIVALFLMLPTVSSAQQQARPSIQIRSPQETYVSGMTTIAVDVAAPSGTSIVEVKFYVDDVEVGSRTEPPWEVQWDAGATFARRVIRVVATDSAGGQSEDTAITLDLETAAFTAEVDVVPLYVNVTDDRGVYIPNMTQDEFEVYENGSKQDILYFDSEPRPMVIGLLIDTSGSMEGIKMERAKQGAGAFLQYITEQDKAFIMGFDAFPHLLQDLTPNVARLRDAIQEMQPQGATSLNMAIVEGCDILVDEPERRALVILSDGFDTVQSVTEGQAIEYALSQDVRLYTIGIFDAANPIRSSGFNSVNPGETSMRAYSDGTGGRTFILNSLGELERAYEEIAAELRSQYSLGYRPETPAAPGEFREIEVRTKRGEARTKPGYYGQ
ncbi:MAG: VWA domain-containing protein [Acidobacteriota bacterium]